MLAGRYRIVALLDRGGMGEVYRADDLKLGQPVALTFLPPVLPADSRFRAAPCVSSARSVLRAPPKSGHLMCELRRTDHVLTTAQMESLDNSLGGR
jgi:hypothetical protein